MPELIDKKYLLAYLAGIKPDEYVSAFGEAAVQVIGLIEEFVKEMPTIEPEVRHGRWITKDGSTAKCSCCGWWQRTTMYYLPDDIPAFSKCYRFCTSCGAQMDADHIADVSKKVGGADNG
jgi:hypothetical protein